MNADLLRQKYAALSNFTKIAFLTTIMGASWLAVEAQLLMPYLHIHSQGQEAI
jgi:hypothetical protein